MPKVDVRLSVPTNNKNTNQMKDESHSLKQSLKRKPQKGKKWFYKTDTEPAFLFFSLFSMSFRVCHQLSSFDDVWRCLTNTRMQEKSREQLKKKTEFAVVLITQTAA